MSCSPPACGTRARSNPPLDLVVRGDGSVPLVEDAIGPKEEFKELAKIFKDWRMIALFPMFFSSNYCK